ncbi:unnamed protein product, partial [Protopolystoma xenopodis]
MASVRAWRKDGQYPEYNTGYNVPSTSVSSETIESENEGEDQILHGESAICSSHLQPDYNYLCNDTPVTLAPCSSRRLTITRLCSQVDCLSPTSDNSRRVGCRRASQNSSYSHTPSEEILDESSSGSEYASEIGSSSAASDRGSAERWAEYMEVATMSNKFFAETTCLPEHFLSKSPQHIRSYDETSYITSMNVDMPLRIEKGIETPLAQTSDSGYQYFKSGKRIYIGDLQPTEAAGPLSVVYFEVSSSKVREVLTGYEQTSIPSGV